MSSGLAEKSRLCRLAQNREVSFVFYDTFCELCKARGVSVTKATVDIGLSRTIGTKWKRTGATPNGETLNKIAEYFGVTTDFLLGGETEKAPTRESEHLPDGLNDIYFSLAKDLQDAKIDPEDIRNFAKIISKNMQKENDKL